MKQIKMLCAAGLAVLLLSGCGSKESKISYIGASKAKTAALEAAGMTASQAEFTSVDLSDHNGQDYYRVEFTALGEPYAYDIDALTGVIIDSDVPAGSTRADLDGAGDSAADTNGEMITDKDAKARALAHAGVSSDQATFLKNTLDYEDGKKVYEVEFYTVDGREFDYEIDASTGEVLSFDYDAQSAAVPAPDGSKISAQKAKELALAQVPGAAQSDILEFETDHDDGRMEYKGKISYDGMEYEFEIDAYSGAFRSWEAEPSNERK